MPIGRFADLSSYRKAVDEPTASPLDSLLQGYQQGRQIRQMPQEDLMKQIQLQLAQAKLRDALNPEEAILRRFKAELGNKLALDAATSPETGVIQSPDTQGTLGSEQIQTPKALTPEDQSSLESGSNIALPKAGTPITPISLSGKPTGFARDTDLTNQTLLQKANLKAKPQLFINKNDPNEKAYFRPGEEPEGFSAFVKPLSSSVRQSGITGNEIAKAINEGTAVGVSYDKNTHGDLSDPANYALFKNAISDASDVQGAITDPKVKPIALKIQTAYNKEPVVSTMKQLDIFGKEAGDAIQHIIDHPDEPAGARQIEAFDSFIKAFSAGKPTIAQYGQIEKYQSVEGYLTNLFQRIQSGQRLTNEELQGYSDALRDAKESIRPAYETTVQQYEDQLISNGVKRKAAEKVVKNIFQAPSNKKETSSPEEPMIPSKDGSVKLKSGNSFKLVQ